MRIGAHVSVAGGLAKAVGNARDAGCESLQVFVSNARGWAPPPVDPAGDERFRADLDDAGLGPLFVHAPYLVNFASATPLTRERSREVVAATLAKAASIGAAGVVVHAGQALASGRAAGLATTRETLLPLADTIAAQALPDLVEVPEVVGLSKREAEQRLAAAGLRARYVLPVGSRVVEQSPAPGEQAKRGSEVRLLLNLF